jgi:hypothetical protein
MKWLLVLTCACAQPSPNLFDTHEACLRAAQWALYGLNINVPRYRCEPQTDADPAKGKSP